MSISRNAHVAMSNLGVKGHDKGPSYIIIRRMDYRGRSGQIPYITDIVVYVNKGSIMILCMCILLVYPVPGGGGGTQSI